MPAEPKIKSVLERLAPAFSSTARKCMESLFMTQGAVKEPWTVVEQLDGNFQYMFMQGASNERFVSKLCLGIAIDTMSVFLGCPIELDEAKDAFKEFSNTFSGMIMDIEDFRDTFGVLKQAVPGEALGQAFFPRAWGIAGKLWIGEQWLYMGYSIERNAGSHIDVNLRALLE